MGGTPPGSLAAIDILKLGVACVPTALPDCFAFSGARFRLLQCIVRRLAAYIMYQRLRFDFWLLRCDIFFLLFVEFEAAVIDGHPRLSVSVKVQYQMWNESDSDARGRIALLCRSKSLP